MKCRCSSGRNFGTKSTYEIRKKRRNKRVGVPGIRNELQAIDIEDHSIVNSEHVGLDDVIVIVQILEVDVDCRGCAVEELVSRFNVVIRLTVRRYEVFLTELTLQLQVRRGGERMGEHHSGLVDREYKVAEKYDKDDDLHRQAHHVGGNVVPNHFLAKGLGHRLRVRNKKHEKEERGEKNGKEETFFCFLDFLGLRGQQQQQSIRFVAWRFKS